MNQNTNIISRALSSRESLVELIAIAIVLAFGVNLASTNVAEYWGNGSRITGLGGWVLILVAISYLFIKLRRSLRNTTTINAVVVLDIQKNKVIDAPGYIFSEKLKKVLNAAFVENEAYLNIWNDSPLLETTNVSPFPSNQAFKEAAAPVIYSAVFESENTQIPETGSLKLLIEAIEYLLIESISDQLSEYFNHFENRDSRVKEINGQDMPQVLLSNRFLRLFTTPLEERPIYAKVTIPKSPEGGILRSITGSDGSLFKSLRIFVPKASSMTRPDKGVLVFSSNRANIKLRVKYTSEMQESPEYFIELYMAKNPLNVALLKVEIALDVSIPLRSLLWVEGWHYYQWADSLPSSIFKGFDFNAYLSRINWSQIRAQARVNTIAKRLEEKSQLKDAAQKVE